MQKTEGRRQKADYKRQNAVNQRSSVDCEQMSVGRRDMRKRFLPPASRLLLPVLLLTAHCILPTTSRAQEVVDKMVATVNADGATECGGVCLITYSDLLWQLALQPNTPLDSRTSADLSRA